MSRRIGRLARARGERRDAGFSLMEVMVGSALMSVVMAVATGGLVSMYHTTDLTESAALTQTSLTASFNKLDREVRYAYRINDEYSTNDTYGVDYVMPDENNNMLCVQLTLPKAGGTLMRRQWPQTATPASPAATVSAVASNMASAAKDSDGNQANPFDREAPDLDSNYDRLNIEINSTVGQSAYGTTRSYDLTFTALNTVSVTNTTAASSLTCDKG
jgi:prepilin-type N-terminal cleavage/methylation domain-containing protein